MIRGAAAAALRKKQHAIRRPAGSPAKSKISEKPGGDCIREGFYNLDKSTSKNIPFDLEKAFRVRFSEVKSGNEEFVYYKDDEDRFSQRYTLKLQTNKKYKITLEVEEGTEVLHIKFGDIFLDKFHVVSRLGEQSTKVDYTFLWYTQMMNLTVRKNRAVLPFSVRLRNYEAIEFAALVKFYPEETVNHSEGVPLSYLSLQDSETENMKIMKQENRITYKLKFNQRV